MDHKIKFLLRYIIALIVIILFWFLLKKIPFDMQNLYSLYIEEGIKKINNTIDRDTVIKEIRAKNYTELIVDLFKKEGRKIDKNDERGLILSLEFKENFILFTITEHGGKIKKREYQQRIYTWESIFPPVIAIIVAVFTRRVLLSLFVSVWIGVVFIKGLGWDLRLVPLFKDYIWLSIYDQFNASILLFSIALVGMVNIIILGGGVQGVVDIISKIARGAISTKISAILMGLVIFFDDYANTIVVGTTLRPLIDRFKVSREKLAYIVDSTAAPVAGLAVISTWIGYEVGLLNEVLSQLNLNIGGYQLFFKMLPYRFYCITALCFLIILTLLQRDFGPMYRAEVQAFKGDSKVFESKNQVTTIAIKIKDGIIPDWKVAAIPVTLVLLVTFFGILWQGSTNPEILSWIRDKYKGSLFYYFDFTYWRLCFERGNPSFILLVSSLIGSIVSFWLVISKRGVRESNGFCPSTLTIKALELICMNISLFVILLVVLLIHTGTKINSHPFFTISYWEEALSQKVNTVTLIGGIIFILISNITVCYRWFLEKRKGVLFPVEIKEVGVSWLTSFKTMSLAVMILILAWTMRRVTSELNTSFYLVAIVKNLFLPGLLPIVTFLIASMVSFATGTSWGTMGMLIPTVVPLSYHIGGIELMVFTTASVLDGAIFGDHCSPISDTTIMSSIASGCDIIAHVKTQFPYAFFSMIIAGVFGYLLNIYYNNCCFSYLLIALTSTLVILILGKKLPK